MVSAEIVRILRRVMQWMAGGYNNEAYNSGYDTYLEFKEYKFKPPFKV